ncbi:hypothetical protein Nepgr_005848 [Nepenthes gracilis]|uniref:B30.2/SPRY domain-containing protein n=1 Tax=Nepenthes gracilis TaxID=150966 RepID=A0AAD3S3Y4_NEPGR|nr:hypothetical protein Nepgr_005848 [Nepenthes gracilis]
MLVWLECILGGISIAVLATILILLLRRRCVSKDHAQVTEATSRETQSVQSAGALKTHHHQSHHHPANFDLHLESGGIKRSRPNYYVFRRGSSTRPLFNWADQPALITDAVENGWSRFAFTNNHMLSPLTRSSSLLGLRATGDHVRESMQVEMSWEVGQGSVDFMQKIRLNSGLKKSSMNSSSSVGAKSVIRTALPLPGPPLGNSSFPQEAYFEILILGLHGEDEVGKIRGDGERAKLIHENFRGSGNSDSLVHLSGSQGFEELKMGGRGEAVKMSVGLTTGGSLPMRIPGASRGSVGFNSNGSVYLEGMKLVFESEKGDWVRADKVIGCGFDPRQKKVFFTVDSELVHVIQCKSDEFGTPLFPVIAANIDVTVLVNFGQSSFSYAPANAQRTPNPCFVGPLVSPPAAAAAAAPLWYEDSRELFSIGRIDSGWLNHCATKSSNFSIGINNSRTADYDEESEADLFEIVLDVKQMSRGKAVL